MEALASGGNRGMNHGGALALTSAAKDTVVFRFRPMPTMTISSVRCPDCDTMNEEWKDEAVCEECGEDLIQG